MLRFLYTSIPLYLAVWLLPGRQAAAQQWDRILKIDGERCESVMGLQVTTGDDIVTAGVYEDPGGAVFEQTEGPAKTFASNQDTFPQSHSTLFLARYTKQGKLLWVVNAFAANGITPWNLHCDSKGNSIVCGNFRGMAILHSADGKEKVLKGMPAPGARDYAPLNYYVAKYDPKGNLLWAKVALSRDNSVAFESVSDKQNNIYVRAYCTYGEISFNSHTVMSRDSGNYYGGRFGLLLIKYTPSGEEEWIVRGGDFNIKQMLVDDSSNIVLRGNYGSDKQYISTSFGKVYTLEARKTFTQAVLHFSPKGELLRVSQEFPEIKEHGYVQRMVRDSAGNHYALVLPYPSESKGRNFTLSIADKTFTTQWYDIFLAKFDTAQRLLWITQFESPNEERPLDLALDKKGNILLSGWYRGNIKVKDIAGGSVELNSIYQTMFLSSFTPDGALKWACNAGNLFQGFGEHLHLAVNSENQLIAAGQINAPSEFGKIKLTVKGEKGWNSPGWPQKIDYSRYSDGFIGFMNLDEKKDISVTLNLAFNQQFAADLLAQAIAEIKKNTGKLVAEFPVKETTSFTPAAPEPGRTSMSDKMEVLVYPNPASESRSNVMVQLSAPNADNISWSISDPSGKMILSNKENGSNGTANWNFSVSGFAPGIYLLSIESEKERVVKRIVIL